MNGFTRVFLVVLRLAIGWQLLVEGWHKLESVERGKSEGNREFSAEAYLRESVGPCSPFFRQLPGPDADDLALARLTLESETTERLGQRLPHVIRQEWNAYQIAFFTHHELDADEVRKTALRRVQSDHEDRLAEWLTSGMIVIPVKANSAVATVVRPVSEFLDEYRAKVHAIRTAQVEGNPAWGKEFWPKLAQAKAEAGQMRTLLLAEMQRRTGQWKDAMTTYLIEDSLAAYRSPHRAWSDRTFWINHHFEQFPLGTLFPGSPSAALMPGLAGVSPFPNPAAFAGDVIAACPTVFNKPPLKETPAAQATFLFGNSGMDWINGITRWGLTVVGACLILGLFTRTSCVAGAGFMLLFYLSMPPLPQFVGNPRMEGYYLFVNKNLIEMLALLVLATTRSGYWVGFDALLSALNPLRWQRLRLPKRSAARHLVPAPAPLTANARN